MHRWLACHILFPLHERLKGHPTLQILREMERADRFSADELEAFCNERLRQFVASCYAHVPYIRSRMQAIGLQPSGIRTAADLAKLPVMRKTDIRQNRAALRSTAAGRLASLSSGGSTGEPLVFDISRRRSASRVACRQRISRWWGVSIGDPELAIWGSPLELNRQDRVRALRDRLLATRLLSAYELRDETMSRYLDLIETGRWRHVFAYPSAICRLCLHARKTGRKLRHAGIRVIFVTSEMLYPHQRELIRDTFGCPVANGYGGRDSGFIAHECPQGGMHILADAIIAEVVGPDGQPVPPGQPGEILVTDLYSEDAPFLRYATGDVGVLSTRRCPCGRPLPLFDAIEGRTNDAVVAPDGRVMHGQSLIGLLMEIPGIEEFRIFQRRADCFHVQLVCSQQYRRASEDAIRKSWSVRLRSPLEVTFEYLRSLPRERSGKFRHLVSELEPGLMAREQAPMGANG